MSKSRNLYTFLFSVIILGNSASHFLEMIMFISYVGMLNRTRIGIGSITFPRIGPMRGHYVFLISEYINVCTFSIDNYYLG